MDLATRAAPAPTRLDSAWDDYLLWLSFAVPGMLARGNVDAMAHALARLPNDAPIVEIGSFCGLSTCVLVHLANRLRVKNRIITCDSWTFEGQKLGEPLAKDTNVTHAGYRAFVRESFLRNARMFCEGALPFTVELNSDDFFAAWESKRRTKDVFERDVALGGAISFAYIDGNHTYEFAKRDFANVDRWLAGGGFILFDDSADGSAWEVTRVVDEVMRSGRYEVVARVPNYLVRKKA